MSVIDPSKFEKFNTPSLLIRIDNLIGPTTMKNSLLQLSEIDNKNVIFDSKLTESLGET